jgi:hypothetical protein
LARLLPRRLRPWAIGGLFAGMALFATYCLFKYVVPFLS